MPQNPVLVFEKETGQPSYMQGHGGRRRSRAPGRLHADAAWRTA